jgi:hypothetical protein
MVKFANPEEKNPEEKNPEEIFSNSKKFRFFQILKNLEFETF